MCSNEGRFRLALADECGMDYKDVLTLDRLFERHDPPDVEDVHIILLYACQMIPGARGLRVISSPINDERFGYISAAYVDADMPSTLIFDVRHRYWYVGAIRDWHKSYELFADPTNTEVCRPSRRIGWCAANRTEARR
jgi:hypothetical protein